MRKTLLTGRSALLTLILVAIVIAVQLPLAFTSTVQAEGSTGEIEWIRQFGAISPEDSAQAVDGDGNVYVAGYTDGALLGQPSSGGYDAFVRKYDPSGNELWTTQFGTSAFDRAYAVSVDSSGVYIAGYTYGTLGQSSAGAYDAFVRKLSITDGSEIWTKQFGTALYDEAYAICVDASGVYVAGETGDDAFICKLRTTDGTLLWIRQFGTPASDTARAICLDSSGIYVAGQTGGALPGQNSTGGYDAFVGKYDPYGRELWITQFGSTTYDEAYAICVDSSAVYVAGDTYGTLPNQTRVGAYDAFVCKLNTADGSELWTRQFGTVTYDLAGGICVDSSGVYFAGYTRGALPGQNSTGGYDAFVRKYDPSGNELWTTQFGTSAYDYAYGISADCSGVYVAGETRGTFPGQTSSGYYDAFVRKYDASGNELWTRQFGAVSPVNSAQAVDGDGNVYVAGYTDRTLPGQTSAGNYDVFVRKYDPNGNELWTTQFGTSAIDYALAISVDSSGIYVAGATNGALGQGSAGNYDVFVRKYDPSGNVLWTTQFGSLSDDYACGISADSSGVYVAGDTYGTLPNQTSAGSDDAFVCKLNSTDGSELWTRQFGTSYSDTAYGICLDPSGIYVAGQTGGALGQSSAGKYDAFVRKYDSDGNVLWTTQFGSTTYDEAYAICVDSSAVYVAGDTLGALPNQTRVGGYDAFVCKLNTTDGSQLWTRQFGTLTNDLAGGICVDSSGVYIAGYTYGTLGQSSAGSYDVFVRKYDSGGSELWTTQFGTSTYDYAYGISADCSGLYVAGTTWGALPGQTSSGGIDAFVVKFSPPNNPPTADAGGPYTVDEGDSVAVTASGSDPDGDPLTFAWDLDNDGIFETPGASVTFEAASIDGPSSHTVTVQVTDSGGLSATAQTTVDVLNVAPTVGEITAPVNPIPVNTTIQASADFTDPGVLDTHTALWDWGDNTTSEGTVDEANGSVTGSHIYAAVGVYEVTLTVTDDDGGSGQSVFRYVVIYDPSAGFATGGGWIDSPQGAYTPDPSLTGKASFGFIAKYQQGADTPSGQTEFQFKVADLNFQSTGYQWLVIAGAKAQFKGWGTINGTGDYGFMLTATDGQINGGGGVDKFRIKIWDEETGEVVYDNQIDDATQAIGGGSIVIHSK